MFQDMPSSKRAFWLIVDRGDVDLCVKYPGFDVDLYSRSDLRTMTAIWMGLDTVSKAISNDRLVLTGDKAVAKSMQNWLGLSPFAVQEKQVA